MTPPASRASTAPPAPRLLVRPDVVRRNAAAVCERFEGRVLGVTKAVCGEPAVAAAMLAGGVDGLADARTANLARLDEHVATETTQLVGPMLSQVDRVIRVADRSLHTEPRVVEALSAIAADRGLRHRVVVMVDVGDRREGVLPDDLVPLLEQVVDLPGIEVVGVGTNVGCFGGVLPTPAKMDSFVSVVESAEAALDWEFPIVSGGSSVTLPLVESGELPDRINELRVGEALLLGTDVTRDRRIPYLAGDAFELQAEVVERKRKPSSPDGERGQPVDGPGRSFPDRGERTRAILALGTQDTVPGELEPLLAGVDVLGASSDHTVLDVTDCNRRIAVGDTIGFRPGYNALVRSFTSEYVHVVVERPDGNSTDAHSSDSRPTDAHSTDADREGDE